MSKTTLPLNILFAVRDHYYCSLQWMKFMHWQCWNMHGQPIYGGSVEILNIEFHGLSWWWQLTRFIPQDGTRSHYRWLWATMWFLGIELRYFGRAGSTHKCWAITVACILLYHLITKNLGNLCVFFFLWDVFPYGRDVCFLHWFCSSYLIC